MTHPSDFPDWGHFLEAQGVDFRLAYFDLARAYGTDFLDFICAFDGKWGIDHSIPTDAQRSVFRKPVHR